MKENILRIPGDASARGYEQRPQARTAESYVSGLMARFSSPQPVPSAGQGTSPAGDIYTLLSTAATTLGLHPSTTSSPAARDAQIDSLAHSGALIPPHLKSVGERVEFVAAQREKLRVLLGALDREAGELEMQRDVEMRVGNPVKGGGGKGLMSRKSEGDFERVERDEAGGKEAPGVGAAGGGGWFGGWMGGGGAAKATKEGKEQERAEARSSGVET